MNRIDAPAKKLGLIAMAGTAICLALIMTVSNLGCDMTAGRTSKAAPNDSRARYLLFPKDADAGIRRAIIVSGTELYGSGDIGYYDGETEKHIARDRLSLYPPPGKSEEYVAALNGEIIRWGKETDILKIGFSLEGKRATLTGYMKSGKINRCVYNIRDDRTTDKVTIRYGL